MIRQVALRQWLPATLLILGLLTVFGAKTLTTARAASPSVDLVNFAFQPGTLTIPVHSTVVWTNTTTATSHTVTADHGSFDSGNLSPGQTFSLTFNVPGTYDYHCTYHQSLGMVGSIVVQGSPPNLQPRAYLPVVFEGT